MKCSVGFDFLTFYRFNTKRLRYVKFWFEIWLGGH